MVPPMKTRFNSQRLHHFCRSNSIGGMLPCQGKCRGFDPVSCSNACIAQLVEHTLCTGEVMRSSRIASSILQRGRIVAECGGLLIRCSLLEPRVQIPPLLPFIGVWCNGSITLSKSADWGPSPCTPASTNSFMEKSICKSIIEQDVGLKVSSI